MHGYVGQILRVNLTNSRIHVDKLDPDLAQKFIGGRGLNEYLLFREVGPNIGPFDSENRLIYGVGPLGGTLSPASGKFQVTFKSPFLSGFGTSSCGGSWGPELKYAGYDHIVIEGKAEKPVYLWINNSEVEIRNANQIWGMNTWETQRAIRKDVGEDEAKIICIGQAGEKMVFFANIMTELTNAAGRTGGGSVMGSKNLKAIAVRGSKSVSVARPKEFQRLCEEVAISIRNDPSFLSLSTLGTPGATKTIASVGMYPIRNWRRAGMWEKVDDVDGVTINEKYIIGRKSCLNCHVHCHGFYAVHGGPNDGLVGGGPEYETVCAFGSKCENSDLESILVMNNLCNQYGLDSVSTGNVICLLMDLHEHGLVTRKDIDDVSLEWGDTQGMIALIHKIANREGIGDLLALGSYRFAEKIGSEAKKFVIHMKGLTPTGVETRSAMGAALSFGLSPRGAHHLSGIPTVEWIPNPEVAEFVAGFKEAGEPLSYHPVAKARSVIFYENLFEIIDSLGVCKFQYGHVPFFHSSKEELIRLKGYLVDLYSAATGFNMTWENLVHAGERAYQVERAYIIREGMSRKDDLQPERIFNEDIEAPHPGGLPRIDKKKYEQMLDTYYNLRGWDENGRPTLKKLEAIGLPEIAKQLKQYRVFKKRVKSGET